MHVIDNLVEQVFFGCKLIKKIVIEDISFDGTSSYFHCYFVMDLEHS